MLIGAANFCAQTTNVWRVLGYVVMVIKIVIPLVLIVLGMIDLGKAVISSDDKAINKAVSTLIRRFIAAVLVFFIPTIINALFSIVTEISTSDPDYIKCVNCITDPNDSTGCPKATNNFDFSDDQAENQTGE